MGLAALGGLVRRGGAEFNDNYDNLRPNQHPRSLKGKASQIEVQQVARSNDGYQQVRSQIGKVGESLKARGAPKRGTIVGLVELAELVRRGPHAPCAKVAQG